jgi:hypothetical protein
MAMLIVFFVVGLVSFVAGLLILTVRAFGPDMKAISLQTAQVAQKGLAEDVAGVVGNAAALLDALKAMTDSAKGVGLFLVIAGLVVMFGTSYLALRIYLGVM